MAWLQVALTGVTALRLHPWRSVATTACVVAALAPYLAGLGICGGIARESSEAIEEGADLYVTGMQFGRHVPVPLAAATELADLPGVVKVVPRIVGKLAIGADRHTALVVGMPPEEVPAEASFVSGELFGATDANELIVGGELAARLRLQVGSQVPPFYSNRKGERVSKVVGIFSPAAPLWQANLIFTSFDTAARLFDQPALATEMLVYCRAGSEEELAAAIRRKLHRIADDGSRFDVRVSGRDAARALWTAAAAHRDGLFHLHCLLAVSTGILTVLVTSGFGGTERRQEVGILKTIGWRTDEILFRNVTEGLLLTLAGASLAVLVAWLWLDVFNGWAIANLFVPGLSWRPHVRVPFALTPLPVVLAGLLAWVLVTSGSLYTTWRTAMTPPASVLRSAG
ncbi:MAG TPA: FtsX-like permease family protein [Pirellulales bacterium]|nr:FtsX-like permease family protein [Pirellulales bacterium]